MAETRREWADRFDKALGWRSIDTAPRDGTWVLLEGEMDGGDTSTVKLGRYEPTTETIGSQTLTYEWRCLDDSFGGFTKDDEWIDAQPSWNWYPEGRVSQWRPLPA